MKPTQSRTLVIRFGDNDFHKTYSTVLETLAKSDWFDWPREVILKVINELVYPCYLIGQAKIGLIEYDWMHKGNPIEFINRDERRLKNYLIIKDEYLLLDGTAETFLANTDDENHEVAYLVVTPNSDPILGVL